MFTVASLAAAVLYAAAVLAAMYLTMRPVAYGAPVSIGDMRMVRSHRWTPRHRKGHPYDY